MEDPNDSNHTVTTSFTEENIFKEGALLKKVMDVALKEICSTNNDKSKKVIDFKHPHELQNLLPIAISDVGCKDIEEIEDIIEKIAKYSVKTSHPHFYNQLYGGLDEVSLSGAWLMEIFNTNLYTFEVAPVFVLLEHYIINQMCKYFGLEDGDGIFSPGGSISNMYGIALARHKRYPDIKTKGMSGKGGLVLLTSDMSHYSIQKAASFMGFGTNQVVSVPTDKNGRMGASTLRKYIHKLKQERREPFFVNATAGTTVLGCFDPLHEISLVCEEEGLWMHVDACWGGSLIFSNRHKHLLNGIERADSISWNPHKMLCAPLQCSTFLVKYKGLLAECNGVGASYLFQQDKYYDVSFDTGDKSIQCGRKADAFKLWIMFKVHGLDCFRRRIDNAFEAASYLENEIKKREGFRFVAEERDFTNICFWYIPPSLRNKEIGPEWWKELHKVAPKIKGRMVKSGTLLVGYQPLEVKNLVNFFRMTITSYPLATHKDMNFVLDEIEKLGNDL